MSAVIKPLAISRQYELRHVMPRIANVGAEPDVAPLSKRTEGEFQSILQAALYRGRGIVVPEQ
jgi:hypothetical protein